MVLTIKLLITPCIIASVSLIERRWGTAVSGWFMGFPFVSAPISIILALQFGSAFADHSAVGTLGGLTSVCVYALVYTATAKKATWPISLGASLGAFFLVTAGLNATHLALWPTFAIDAVVLSLTLWLIPRRALPSARSPLPQWELPARMLMAVVFVWLLTAAANTLGPTLSGLLSPFPLITSVLAPFTHHRRGPAAVTQLLRGVVMGLFSFTCFYVVLAGLLPTLPIPWAYITAAVASMLGGGLALRFVAPRASGQPAGQRTALDEDSARPG